MAKKELRKKTEESLLSRYAEYALVSKSSSNNGFSYVLQKDSRKTYIKVVDIEQEEDEGLDEALLNKLSVGSQHIVSLTNTGDIDDKYRFLEFEHIEGTDISGIKKPMTNEMLLKLAEHVTIAIGDLWKCKIVHRDIKPGNIMLTDEGNFKLVDLGIGYYMETPNRDNTKAKGSRYYSSPEQFFASTDGRVELSFSSDLFSLGMVLYEMAAGQHPKLSWSSKSCYGEAITQQPFPPIEEFRNDLDKELTAFINKLTSIYPADRFLSTQEALSFLKGNQYIPSPNSIYIHDTSNDYSVIDSYLDGTHGDLPVGVVVSMSQGTKRIKDLKKKGLRVLVDPQTYRLPHALASNSDLKKKLGYKKKTMLDDVLIRKDIKSLIEKVLREQIEASEFILPYFAIENIEDNYIEINKLIWRIGKEIADSIDSTKKVYGGLVLNHSITNQTASVNKFINLIYSQYPIDGFYVIYEAPNDKVKTIDSSDFLTGVKRITKVLQSMGSVIIGNTDISYGYITDGVELVIGWSNSKRRFLYETELQGKSSGFMPVEYDRKLLYYVAQLLTFIKSEEETESIYRFAPKSELDCDCDECSSLKPYDGKSPKKLAYAERHYYRKVIEQNEKLNKDPIKNKQAALQSAAELSAKILKSSGGTIKSIPSHETILAVVNK